MTKGFQTPTHDQRVCIHLPIPRGFTSKCCLPPLSLDNHDITEKILKEIKTRFWCLIVLDFYTLGLMFMEIFISRGGGGGGIDIFIQLLINRL
jgi:hypothetical protein